MGVILKENNLIYTYMQHDKFLGSSCWKYDSKTNTLFSKRYYKQSEDNITQSSVIEDSFLTESESNEAIKNLLRQRQITDNEVKLDSSLREKRPKRTVYKLNKKKVREKCNALFGLRQSSKFMAFITISFPVGFPDNLAMQCLNTFFTRCRKNQRLKTYVRVSEYQDNGTIHFHVITNNYMQIRDINRFMAKAIETQIKKHNIITEGIEYVDNKGRSRVSDKFDVNKYNGVDVKRCDNNKKRLNQYLTKYVSKNKVEFNHLAWHCSRDISELFTAETFRSANDPTFQIFKEQIDKIQTYVIDTEYCTIEYLCQKQPDGTFFNPPESWYWLMNHVNQQIFNNHHSKYRFERLPLTPHNNESIYN